MDAELINLGTVNKNLIIIKTEKGSIRLYFSYKTLIACNDKVSQNIWSRTTGKMLNELEPDKKARIKQSEVLNYASQKLKELFQQAGSE